MKWKDVVQREEGDLELDGTRFFRGFLSGALASAMFFVVVALIVAAATRT